MKKPQIYTQAWINFAKLQAHNETNQWYNTFANQQLLPIVACSEPWRNQPFHRQQEVVLMLTAYFHDVISESGGWKRFTSRHQALYTRPIPFYTITENYLPDEINAEDIAFLLWIAQAKMEQNAHNTANCPNPLAHELQELSQQLYTIMDNYFERAPIDNEPTSDEWVMPMRTMDMKPASFPEISFETANKDVERCLKYTNGKPLVFLETYGELCLFLKDELKWETTPHDDFFPDLRQCSHFIIYANKKGMLIAPNVAWYFRELSNPYYSIEKAEAEGYNMFTTPYSCPIDLIRYGMMNDLLPDVQLPFPRGKEVLHNNWDFLMRYFLSDTIEDDDDEPGL